MHARVKWRGVTGGSLVPSAFAPNHTQSFPFIFHLSGPAGTGTRHLRWRTLAWWRIRRKMTGETEDDDRRDGDLMGTRMNSNVQHRTEWTGVESDACIEGTDIYGVGKRRPIETQY